MVHDHSADDVFTTPRAYDWMTRFATFGAHARACSRAADLLGAEAPGVVVDVGSGTGALTFALRERYPTSTIIGVDPGAPMVARARERAAREELDVEFREGFAQDLPVDDGVADAVTCSLSLHHVAESELPRALTEARRVLRPGGLLLVVELAPVGWLARVASGHPHATSPAAYVALLRAAGFVDVRTGRLTRRLLGYVSGRAPHLVR